MGACSTLLPQTEWVEALQLCVAYMGSKDLVVSRAGGGGGAAGDAWAGLGRGIMRLRMACVHDTACGRMRGVRCCAGTHDPRLLASTTTPSRAHAQVALQAAQAVMTMAASMLDDQALIEQANQAQLQASKAATRGGAAAVDAALTAAEGIDYGARRPRWWGCAAHLWATLHAAVAWGCVANPGSAWEPHAPIHILA